MLVLCRKRDESIQIGADIEIRVVDIRNDQVRIGVTAPKSIPVDRAEVAEQKRQEQAMKPDPHARHDDDLADADGPEDLEEPACQPK